MKIEKRIELIEDFYQLDLDKLRAKRLSGADYERERRIVDENRFWNLYYAKKFEDKTQIKMEGENNVIKLFYRLIGRESSRRIDA